ncbi:MAG: flavin monoamine oxidase family protein [Paracoccaceae bacterium]
MFISRRSALKSILSVISYLSLSKFSLGSNQNLAGKNVIVIGAGISGLSAASTLKQQGANVIILEAKNYIGGRIKTNRSLGSPFEYGAGWIHGPSKENPIRNLADRTNSSLFVTDDDSCELLNLSGNDIDEKVWDEIEEIWEEIIYDEIYSDTEGSILDAINEYDSNIWSDPNIRWVFSAYEEFNYGGPVHEISAGLIKEMSGFPTADVIFKDGYDKIINLLAKNLQIQNNSIVKSVNYSSNNITVSTTSKNYECDYVICSVPLGVLKFNSIEFNPALPRYKQESIEKVGFGTVTKLALKFKDQFWDSDVQYYYTVAKETGRWPVWMNYRTFSKEKILMGLCMGDYAKKADLMSTEELIEDGLKVLKNVWEDDVGEVQNVLRTSWLNDPFTKGAYSFPKVDNSEEDFENLAESVDNRLFFCGEHTDLEYLATTHGALFTGIRAAKEVIKANK